MTLAGERAAGVPEILFDRQSEIPSLDVADYGTTYVSEAYVRACINKIPADPAACRRFPRGLGGGQDIYVLSKNPDLDLSGLCLEPEILSAVDALDCTRDGLSAHGWAAATKPGDAVRDVACEQNGSVIARAELGRSRPDVAVYFRDDRFTLSGWSLTAPLAETSPRSQLSIVVTTHSGHRQCVWAGAVPEEAAVEIEPGDVVVAGSDAVLGPIAAASDVGSTRATPSNQRAEAPDDPLRSLAGSASQPRPAWVRPLKRWFRWLERKVSSE